ncbi:hypothetical protein PIB30_046708 [Stylosanthes scabra]|uniref:Uncharacterized protein n=1 Tax=Stylosanthes scabra TaxID=79078 RepID=A0ABU6XHT2_9FABA|nr:hypothetical protein [Stylosanthes scabra]
MASGPGRMTRNKTRTLLETHNGSQITNPIRKIYIRPRPGCRPVRILCTPTKISKNHGAIFGGWVSKTCDSAGGYGGHWRLLQGGVEVIVVGTPPDTAAVASPRSGSSPLLVRSAVAPARPPSPLLAGPGLPCL